MANSDVSGRNLQTLQIQGGVQVYRNVVAGGLQKGQDLPVQKERESLKDNDGVLGDRLLDHARVGVAAHGETFVR